MAWHVRKNRALHENVLALTLTVVSTPRVAAGERLTVERVADHFWRAEARYGFMERPTSRRSSPNARPKAPRSTSPTSPITSATRRSCRARTASGLPRWQEALFAAMARNAARISDYLRLPCDQVVEIGREIEI